MRRAVAAGIPLVVTATEAGQRVWADELRGPMMATLAELGGNVRYADIRDIGDDIASGSVPTRGMLVVPASMDVVSAIATGRELNLLERAAGVTVKEGRRLTLVPRETPLSLPQLRNMVLCAEAGAIVLPAMPAFYQQPRTIDDLAAFMAGRILSVLGFVHALYPTWKGQASGAR